MQVRRLGIQTTLVAAASVLFGLAGSASAQPKVEWSMVSTGCEVAVYDGWNWPATHVVSWYGMYTTTLKQNSKVVMTCPVWIDQDKSANTIALRFRDIGPDTQERVWAGFYAQEREYTGSAYPPEHVFALGAIDSNLHFGPDISTYATEAFPPMTIDNNKYIYYVLLYIRAGDGNELDPRAYGVSLLWNDAGGGGKAERSRQSCADLAARKVSPLSGRDDACAMWGELVSLTQP